MLLRLSHQLVWGPFDIGSTSAEPFRKSNDLCASAKAEEADEAEEEAEEAEAEPKEVRAAAVAAATAAVADGAGVDEKRNVRVASQPGAQAGTWIVKRHLATGEWRAGLRLKA